MRMTSARIAILAAGLALLLWLVKGVAIWVAGGLDKSPVEGPLFLAGFACYVVGAFAFGYSLSGGSVLVRLGLGVVSLVVGLTMINVLQSLTRAVLPDSAGWVNEEAGLWLSAAILVALTQWRLGGRRLEAHPAPAG